MTEYCVTVPICGYALVMVEANDEEEAKKKALEGRIDINDIESWEPLEEIVSGNCFNGMQNEIEAEEA
jgi:hypothetical protein